MNFLEFWYQALGQPIGIVVTTDNRHGLIQKLYQARAEAKDPELAGMSIIQSPTSESQIWIVHKRIESDGPAS